MDQILNQKISNFLQLKNPTDEQIREGATLLLQVSPRSRGIYNSAMARPKSMLPWIRSDLKKHYAIRMRGLTSDTTAAYNDEAVRQVKETLSRRPEDVEEEKAHQVPVLGVRGKRADHDKLPDAIKALWEQNSERWKKIRQLHNQLLVMVEKPGYQACDGNELCHTLREADTQLRKDYAEYDAYVIIPGKSAGGEKKDSVDKFTDDMKAIQNARTIITRGLQRNTQTPDSLKKITDAVNTLVALKQVLKPVTVGKLEAIGIKVPANV